jgi:hypothetical protein
MAITHEYFGSLEFENGYASQKRELDGRSVEVEIDSEDETVSAAELDALANACKRADELCNLVRSRVEQEYEGLLLVDAFDVWIEDDPSLLAQLDPVASAIADVSGKSFAKLLGLGAIHLQPGDDEDPASIVFDLRFGLAQPINYVIAGEFSLALELERVALES